MTNQLRTVKLVLIEIMRRYVVLVTISSEVEVRSFDSCQVFTWYGATIEMDGVTETDYTADEVRVLVSSSTLPFRAKG